ncbi:hypothetical protein [Aureimonas ureilytica]|nr:hypothetical protein [Aureimonas ureilytica]
MSVVSDVMDAIAQISDEKLEVVMVLAGFGLAAYAIYVVASFTRGGK